MKSIHLSGVGAIGVWVLVLVCATGGPASRSIPVPQRQVISCSSDDMKRNYCEADVSGGVQLVKQRSEAPCEFGRTWGYARDRGGIWVDRGCRADFQIGGDASAPGSNVYCASDDGHRSFCQIDTRGGVQMVRKRSGSPCDFGKTWGYDPRGVWVDRGCRADFLVGGTRGDRDQDRDRGHDRDRDADRDRDRDRDGDRDRDHDRDHDRDREQDRDRDRDNPSEGLRPGDGDVQVQSCSSDDMNRHECPANTRSGVRLVRQRSEAECVFGRTWGYDRHAIWVDRGCRADFEVRANR